MTFFKNKYRIKPFFNTQMNLLESYDKYGNQTGSFRTDSSGKIYAYDKYGNQTGSMVRNSNGTVTQYDKYGNVVGTFKL